MLNKRRSGTSNIRFTTTQKHGCTYSLPLKTSSLVPSNSLMPLSNWLRSSWPAIMACTQKSGRSNWRNMRTSVNTGNSLSASRLVKRRRNQCCRYRRRFVSHPLDWTLSIWYNRKLPMPLHPNDFDRMVIQEKHGYAQGAVFFKSTSLITEAGDDDVQNTLAAVHRNTVGNIL